MRKQHARLGMRYLAWIEKHHASLGMCGQHASLEVGWEGKRRGGSTQGSMSAGSMPGSRSVGSMPG
eukprot:36223-Chlamydomonas_euryale.AAC.2